MVEGVAFNAFMIQDAKKEKQNTISGVYTKNMEDFGFNPLYESPTFQTTGAEKRKGVDRTLCYEHTHSRV